MPEIKDSGTRDSFDTGAVRDGQTGKGRFDLLPFEALQEIARVYEAGGEKYTPRNWEKGIPLYRYRDSALRHLMKANSGHTDEPHMAMAAWNIICHLQTEHWIKDGTLPVGELLSELPEAETAVLHQDIPFHEPDAVAVSEAVTGRPSW